MYAEDYVFRKSYSFLWIRKVVATIKENFLDYKSKAGNQARGDVEATLVRTLVADSAASNLRAAADIRRLWNLYEQYLNKRGEGYYVSDSEIRNSLSGDAHEA